MSRLLKPIVVSTVSFASFLFGATAVPAATTCEGLISLSLPHGQVTAAQTIAGGPAAPRGVRAARRTLVSRNFVE